MRRMSGYCFVLVCLLVMASTPCHSEELVVKSCSELLRMAQNYQEDLKTVETMLGSALDAGSGSMDRIKNYKLRKGAVKQQLESVMKAIDARGCVKK
jgi:hypothetical protein